MRERVGLSSISASRSSVTVIFSAADQHGGSVAEGVIGFVYFLFAATASLRSLSTLDVYCPRKYLLRAGRAPSAEDRASFGSRLAR
jgi:hypothetical protein